MNTRTLALGSSAICSGLVGGVLFAFSSFVMPALRKIPAAEGISAMQSINRHAPTGGFGALMGVTVLLAGGVGIDAVLHRHHPSTSWVIAGTALIVAAAVITGVVNVPRNDRLAGLDPTSPSAAQYWPMFVSAWVPANHVRTLCCVLAALSYSVALRGGR